jgi:hypothetical protein
VSRSGQESNEVGLEAEKLKQAFDLLFGAEASCESKAMSVNSEGK